MNALDIKKLLRKRHADPREWVYIEECPTGAGGRLERFLDAWAMSCWPSERNRRVAFEIKVSRVDFRSEVLNPNKRRNALFFSNEFYFVTPKGLVKPEELPADCGLMEADSDKLEIKIRSPYRDSIRPTWNFMAAVLRHQGRKIKVVEEVPHGR